MTELFSGYVGAMLAEAAQAASGGWKAKDCAIYLVTALTVRGKTAAQGATTTNTLVNLQDFFAQVRDGAALGSPELHVPLSSGRTPLSNAHAPSLCSTSRRSWLRRRAGARGSRCWRRMPSSL